MGVVLHLVPPPTERGRAGFVRHPAVLEGATAACGLALVVLVGIEGSPAWQVVRMAGIGAVTSLLIAGELSVPPRWRGRLALVAGVPTMAIAGGFAPHLAKGGPVPVRLATIVLAIAGLVLTAGGADVATRGQHRFRRAASAVVVVAALAVVSFVVGPAIASTNVPRPEIGATPVQVGLAYEEVSLRTDDGVTLAAWYVPTDNGAAVVLRHGAGSTRSDVLDEAAVLAGGGFGVLLVDARGHGGSGGRAMDFGWHGDADIAAATDHLSSRPDVDPDRIGVVGLSMGGEEAVGASGANPAIRAVVAEGATARAAGDEAWLSDEYGVRGLVQEQLERAQDLATDPLTSASVPTTMRSAVAASDGTRYLLVTAGERPDEAHAAAHVEAAAPDRVETWEVDGAGHTAGLTTAPEEWARRVNGFLTDALLSDVAGP